MRLRQTMVLCVGFWAWVAPMARGAEGDSFSRLRATATAFVATAPVKVSATTMAIRADDRRIVFKISGKEIPLSWSECRDEDLAGLFGQIASSLEQKLDVVDFCRAAGLQKTADELLKKLASTEAGKIATQRFLALRLDDESLAGKLENFDGVWMTPEQKTGHDAMAKAYPDREAFTAAARGRARLAADFLAARSRECVEEILASPAFKNLPASFVADYFAALKQARAEALKHIRDTAAYPDADHGRAGQAGVTKAVDVVRRLWLVPMETLAGKDAGVGALWEKIKSNETLAMELDFPLWRMSAERLALMLSKALREKLPAAATGAERVLSERNSAILDGYDKLKLTAGEIENIRATSEYRWMMGLNALRVDEKACAAARSHVKYLVEHDRYEHTVKGHPDGENPVNRLEKFGCTVYACGEVLMRQEQDPLTAWTQWTLSSAHHRLLVTDMFTHAGVGLFAGEKNGSCMWAQKLYRETKK